jgi:WXXGXW repeat (2 copies)
MKLNLICGLVVAAALSVPAAAQVGIYIGGAPPALRYEERGPEPGPGYAWVEGYWAPNGRHYRWVAGRWDRPLMKAPIGTILITITNPKVGNCMRATGITRITVSIAKITDTTTITS